MAEKIFAFSGIRCCVFSLNSDTLHKLFDLVNKNCIKPNSVELCHIAVVVG